jgi:hypothetical protein
VDEAGSDNLPTRFTPDFGRFVVAELWSGAIVVVATVVVFYLLRGVTSTWLLAAAGVTVLGVFGQAAVARRNRLQIVIGDDWIGGPGSTSVRFDMVDWKRSGIDDRRIRIRPERGNGIDTKATWYTPEDIAEMKRLIRDRCAGVDLPASF